MMIDEDDPRLTAYALNEIEENEALSISGDINNSGDCLDRIDAIKKDAILLNEAFDLEIDYSLTEEQRNKIFESTGLLAVTKSKDELPEDLTFFGKESSKYVGNTNTLEGDYNESNKKSIYTSLVAAAAVIFLTIVLLQRKDLKQKEVAHRSPLNEALIAVEIIDEKVSTDKKKEMWARRQVGANPVATNHSFRYGKPLNKSFDSDNLAISETNDFKDPSSFDNRLSFFSPNNFGTQSYEELRSFMLAGKIPSSESLHVGELINAFEYNYEEPKIGDNFSVSSEFISCPWAKERFLLCIGIKVSDRSKPQSEESLLASKVQMAVEFNPARVSGYRLIGESESSQEKLKELDQNVLLDGQAVTVLYEIVTDENKDLKLDEKKSELASIRIDYIDPISGEEKSKLSSVLDTKIKKFEQSSDDTRFAASVASYGMLLKDKKATTQASYDLVIELANNALGADKNGKRSEFINWVIQTREMVNK